MRPWTSGSLSSCLWLNEWVIRRIGQLLANRQILVASSANFWVLLEEIAAIVSYHCDYH
jgi:hypothetical protein